MNKFLIIFLKLTEKISRKILFGEISRVISEANFKEFLQGISKYLEEQPIEDFLKSAIICKEKVTSVSFTFVCAFTHEIIS